MNKIYAFDYLVTLLEEWHCALQPSGGKSLSKLSVLKLLFLVAAPKEDSGKDLLNIFNNFCAMPYGPVESDIYNAIQRKELPSFIISDREVVRKVQSKKKYDKEDFAEVKDAVEELKGINAGLVLLNPFGLVEITHKWDSWNSSMRFAEFLGSLSYAMSTESIRNDSNKCFS